MKLRSYENPNCDVNAMLKQDKQALVNMIILQKQTLVSVEDYLTKTLTFRHYSRGTEKVIREALIQLSRVIESRPDELKNH